MYNMYMLLHVERQEHEKSGCFPTAPRLEDTCIMPFLQWRQYL